MGKWINIIIYILQFIKKKRENDPRKIFIFCFIPYLVKRTRECTYMEEPLDKVLTKKINI